MKRIQYVLETLFLISVLYLVGMKYWPMDIMFINEVGNLVKITNVYFCTMILVEVIALFFGFVMYTTLLSGKKDASLEEDLVKFKESTHKIINNKFLKYFNFIIHSVSGICLGVLLGYFFTAGVQIVLLVLSQCVFSMMKAYDDEYNKKYNKMPENCEVING